MKNLKTIAIWALLFVSAPAFSATSWLPVYGNKGDRTPKSVDSIKNLYTSWTRMNCTKVQYQMELAATINEEIIARNWPKGPNALTSDNIDYVFTMLREGSEVDAEVLTAAVDNTGIFHSVKRSKYIAGERWLVIIPSEAFGYAGVTDSNPIKVCLNTCMNPKNRQKATNWIDDEQPLDQGPGLANRPGTQTQSQGGGQQSQAQGTGGNTYNYYYQQQQQQTVPDPYYNPQPAQVVVLQQPVQSTPPIYDNGGRPRANGAEIVTAIATSITAAATLANMPRWNNGQRIPDGYGGYCQSGSGGSGGTVININNSNTNSNSQYQSGIIKYTGGTTVVGGGGTNPTNGGGGVPVNSTNGRMMNTGFGGGSIAGTTSIGPGGQVIKW